MFETDAEKFAQTLTVDKLKREAKDKAKMVTKTNLKISLKKGIIRALISVVVFSAVSILVVWLNKAGVVVSEENKAELIKMLIECLIGGVSVLSFAGQNAVKKR